MKELALVGFVQSCFFALIVLMKRERKSKDYFLTAFFLLVGAELLYRYLQFMPSFSKCHWLASFDVVYWALLGPALFLYVQFVIVKDKKLSTKQLWHLSPLMLSLFPLIDFLLNSMDLSFTDYYNQSLGIMRFLLHAVWEFASAVYVTFTIVMLLLHRKKVKVYFSSIENKELNWLLLVTSGFAFYLYISYLFWILKGMGLLTVPFKFIEILVPVLTGYVFIVGLFGFRQEGIFLDVEIKEIKQFQAQNTKLEQKEKAKYLKSGLSETERECLVRKLTGLMEGEKPYLDCELKISDIAKSLNVNTHKISQVINESFKQNYYDFVNSYRVDEIKKKLADAQNDKFDIMSIAYDSGFSSKSSFYTIFRKHTKLTPSEYRKQRQL